MAFPIKHKFMMQIAHSIHLEVKIKNQRVAIKMDNHDGIHETSAKANRYGNKSQEHSKES